MLELAAWTSAESAAPGPRSLLLSIMGAGDIDINWSCMDLFIFSLFDGVGADEVGGADEVLKALLAVAVPAASPVEVRSPGIRGVCPGSATIIMRL